MQNHEKPWVWPTSEVKIKLESAPLRHHEPPGAQKRHFWIERWQLYRTPLHPVVPVPALRALLAVGFFPLLKKSAIYIFMCIGQMKPLPPLTYLTPWGLKTFPPPKLRFSLEYFFRGGRQEAGTPAFCFNSWCGKKTRGSRPHGGDL